jgi:hypothetical protein
MKPEIIIGRKQGIEQEQPPDEVRTALRERYGNLAGNPCSDVARLTGREDDTFDVIHEVVERQSALKRRRTTFAAPIEEEPRGASRQGTGVGEVWFEAQLLIDVQVEERIEVHERRADARLRRVVNTLTVTRRSAADPDERTVA